MLDRFDRKVDVELRPVEVAGSWLLQLDDRFDRCPLEPWELLKRQKQLAIVQQ
jgi:hypothetical protein